jgi:hypothetical protein
MREFQRITYGLKDEEISQFIRKLYVEHPYSNGAEMS